MNRRPMNPGSIHFRVASLQQKIEDAITVGNLVLYANLLRRLRLYASPRMTMAQKREYESMPGLAEGDSREAPEIYEHLCQREEFLYEILQDDDVLWKGRHAKGDASALDDEEETEEVPA